MIRPLLLLCMAAALSNCASLSYPLPKCDGYSRRPLNRSLWQWEKDSSPKPQYSDARPAFSSLAASYVEESKEPAAFAHLDVDASYRRCEG